MDNNGVYKLTLPINRRSMDNGTIWKNYDYYTENNIIKKHEGRDYGISFLEPIVAILDGKVISVELYGHDNDKRYQNSKIEIEHNNYLLDGKPLISRYVHSRFIIPGVGDEVKQGEAISLAGGYNYFNISELKKRSEDRVYLQVAPGGGNTDCAHLHFALCKVQDKVEDPQVYYGGRQFIDPFTINMRKFSKKDDNKISKAEWGNYTLKYYDDEKIKNKFLNKLFQTRPDIIVIYDNLSDSQYEAASNKTLTDKSDKRYSDKIKIVKDLQPWRIDYGDKNNNNKVTLYFPDSPKTEIKTGYLISSCNNSLMKFFLVDIGIPANDYFKNNVNTVYPDYDKNIFLKNNSDINYTPYRNNISLREISNYYLYKILDDYEGKSLFNISNIDFVFSGYRLPSNTGRCSITTYFGYKGYDYPTSVSEKLIFKKNIKNIGSESTSYDEYVVMLPRKVLKDSLLLPDSFIDKVINDTKYSGDDGKGTTYSIEELKDKNGQYASASLIAKYLNLSIPKVTVGKDKNICLMSMSKLPYKIVFGENWVKDFSGKSTDGKQRFIVTRYFSKDDKIFYSNNNDDLMLSLMTRLGYITNDIYTRTLILDLLDEYFPPLGEIPSQKKITIFGKSFDYKLNEWWMNINELLRCNLPQTLLIGYQNKLMSLYENKRDLISRGKYKPDNHELDFIKKISNQFIGKTSNELLLAINEQMIKFLDDSFLPMAFLGLIGYKFIPDTIKHNHTIVIDESKQVDLNLDSFHFQNKRGTGIGRGVTGRPGIDPIAIPNSASPIDTSPPLTFSTTFTDYLDLDFAISEFGDTDDSIMGDVLKSIGEEGVDSRFACVPDLPTALQQATRELISSLGAEEFINTQRLI